MAEGASFTNNDIPLCPTGATDIPEDIITWEDAKAIYKKNRISGNASFNHPAYVCFYMDDYKFDGARGIWHDYDFALKVLQHFAGAITPDFSTYQDFPEPLKLYATYRMRLFGYWLGKNGVPVINNVRWGTPETYRYCIDGIPKHSMVAIGTVGRSPRKRRDRTRFEKGLRRMVDVMEPKTIVIYGSANYPCFAELRKRGIEIASFPGKKDRTFRERRHNEQTTEL